MKVHAFRASLCAALLLAAFGQYARAADAALQAAPADGWASQNGGTIGGSTAAAANIYAVSNRSQLLAAISAAGTLPKIIKVVGTIDMTEGLPFASHADQVARGEIKLKDNTSLIGDGTSAGITNGYITISNVSQVIVRNLKIVNPCDVTPVWDPSDGATGNWNSEFDGITVSGSTNVWIDHNTFTDAPKTDDTLAIENGKTKQCHDGALDIKSASNYVTVSYNVFNLHDKNNLVGSSDSATGDEGNLKITFSNNVFNNITQRAPRVRYGQVHVFNNYFVGSKNHPVYPHSYSIGTGIAAKILSNNNVFEITGATGCDSVVSNPGSSASGAFKDTGSLLNGAVLSGCSAPNSVVWTPPYAFTPRPVSLVKGNTLLQAGSGKLTTSVSGSSSSASSTNNAGLAGVVIPALNETAAYIDTNLSISFDSIPVLGTTGKIYIRKFSDDSIVDTIDISSTPAASDTQTVIPKTNMEIDAIGLGAFPDSTSRARFVFYKPVNIAGNVATIKPHNNKLDWGTAYYVTMDSGVLTGSVGGNAFAGVAKGDGWAFTTRSAPSSYTNVTVDDDGNAADFRTLQGALNWVMKYCSTGSSASYGCNTVATAKTISVRNGSYNEMNALRNVSNLTIAGESREGVVIGYDNFESYNSGSGATATSAGTALTTSGKTLGHRTLGGGRASFLIETADLLTLTNFTLQNPHVRSTLYDNQAETLYYNTSTTTAAARLVAKQMNFLSQQDTLQLKGYSWFYQSKIAGNVDYIWGNVMAALFEESEIRHVQDTSSNSAGFLVQSRAIGTVTGTGAAATFAVADKGFVFLNSSLTNDGLTKLDGTPQQAYLARNGAAGAATIDQIIFINTKMGSHIQAAGWCVGTGKSNTVTFQQAIAGQSGICSASSNPTPQPDIATDAMGWREYNSMDADGNPLDKSARLTSLNVNIYTTATSTVVSSTKTIAPSKILTGIPAGYNSRAEIFSGSTIGGAWSPVP